MIERYRRRKSSVEDALIEMYLAGISVRIVPQNNSRRRFLNSSISTRNQ